MTKILKAIFGSTAKEKGDELAALQAKVAAWAAARAIAVRVAKTAPNGAVIVPVLGYADAPSAILIQKVDHRVKVFPMSVVGNHGVSVFTAASIVSENYEGENVIAANFTPFEGSWSAWRKAHVLRCEQGAKAEQDIKNTCVKAQTVASTLTAGVRQRHVTWFSETYSKAVYQLWLEEFLSTQERDVMLSAFETKGKLFDEAETVLGLRNSVMELCPTPVDAKYISTTASDIEAVSIVVADWVNGDLSIKRIF